MRILFDGYWLKDGPPSGRMVLHETIGAWAIRFPEDEIIVAVPSHKSMSDVNLPASVQIVSTHLRIHPLINFLELRLIAKRLRGVDAIFCQNFAAASKNSVVFLHDVLFQSNPEWFTRLERAYFGLMVGMAKKARVVFTSSKSEKSRIEHYNPALNKIVPTGLGISKAFTDGTVPLSVPDLVPHSFILSVGRLNTRKNLQRTIEGALESGVVSVDFPLVIAGEASGKTEDLCGTTKAAIKDGRVRFLGFVPTAQLVWLYRNAALMTFLSLDEGYGLPPVEAMLVRTRVVASDIPVMREVLGLYAVYVNPTDTLDIARAIRSECLDQSSPRPPSSAPTWERVVEVSRGTLVDPDFAEMKEVKR